MDALLIAITVLMVLIIIGISFYLFIVYCHPEDKGFGTSIPAKIIIVLGLALTWGQLLLVPLDVSNAVSNGGINMEVLYSIMYILIYIFCTAIIPFMITLYESDEDDPLLKRLLWTLFTTFLIQVFCALLIFVSYIWLSNYYNNSKKQKMYVVMYMFLCMSFGGWFLLALFGGAGLFTLPLDLIKSFINRPKIIKPQVAKQKKKQIQTLSAELVTQGQSLKQQEILLSKSQQGWWARRKLTGQLNHKVDMYKKNVLQLQQLSETFQAQLNISKQNPAIAFIWLIVGIFCLFFSIIWIIQLLIGVIIRNSNGQALYGFVNNLLVHLNQQGLNFISTGIFGVFTIYLLWCVQKGNLSFGIRIPFIMSFHPMKKNQTYLNSFLFNINLMLLGSMATTQLSVFAFEGYTYIPGCFIGNVFQTQVSQLPFFGYIYTKRIFPIIMLCIFGLQAIFWIIKSCCLDRKKKKEK